jgi:hypothetical protein
MSIDSGTEAIIELTASKAAKKALEEHEKRCPQLLQISRNTARLENIVDTVYGNNTDSNPGLKTIVHDLHKTVVGDAKDSGLVGAVKTLNEAYTSAKGLWWGMGLLVGLPAFLLVCFEVYKLVFKGVCP